MEARPEGSQPRRRQRLWAYLGPGFLISVGYSDPGNWATSIAGGSAYGYALLWVVVGSSLIAMFLQHLSARIGIASGKDLARLCRDHYPKPIAIFLWLLAEIAIIATDLAELIGTAIGLALVFGLPLQWGVFITALDVFLLLALQSLGFRKLEIFIITLLAMVFTCFVAQVYLAQPNWADAAQGLVPSATIFNDKTALYVALGIIGATVMPHNLYLHSGLVLMRDRGESNVEKRSILRLVNWDSILALSVALLINAAILILAAAAFHAHGEKQVTDLFQARDLLQPLLGSALAAKLFGLALLFCGLNSSVTATMAGQMVMEGFINFRMAPALRRLFTRLVAIVPAMTAVLYFGTPGLGQLLIASQVTLALQLPFALVPMIQFACSRKILGGLQIGWFSMLLAISIAALLIALNILLVWTGT